MKTEDVKDVSYIVFESTISRFDRVIKRLWVVILILIFLLLGTNLAWLYYESQFEEVTETTTTTTTQTVERKADGDSNNSFIGGDNNASDTKNKDKDGSQDSKAQKD